MHMAQEVAELLYIYKAPINAQMCVVHRITH